MNKKFFVSYEPFYYGRRLKAYIKIIENKENQTRVFIAQLFTHNRELIKQKTFFNFSKDYKKQNEEYIKCHDFVLNYLNTCKY